jgi:hypothetical protein
MRKICFFIQLFIALSVLISPKSYSQWTQGKGLENVTITSLASIGTNLFAGLDGGDVYVSKDSGATWTKLASIASYYQLPNTSFTEVPSVILYADYTNLIGGVGDMTIDEKLHLSTDEGLTWTDNNSGFTENVNCFTKLGATLFAGTDNGVYNSYDNGSSWNSVSTGLSSGNYDSLFHHAPQVMRLAAQGPNLFAGTTGEGIFLSSNNGTSWKSVNKGLTNLSIYGLAVIGTDVFAGVFSGDSTGGIFRSSDNGTSWHAVNTGMTNFMVDVLISNGTNLFSGNNAGVYLSTNEGGNWTNISPDSKDGPHCAYSLAVYGSYLIAGCNGVWRYPLSQLTGVDKNNGLNPPSGFVLEQNFPNPFNPATTIEYTVPKAGMVKIKVYNVLGTEVTTLVNEEKSPGNYKVVFNAGKFASGVYFYRMHAGSFTETKKLLLLK